MLQDLSTRRAFLKKGLTILAVAPTVPTFLDQTVWALANPLDVARTQRPSGKDGKILVVVQLSGGNDGLNTVVPYADDAYHRARPGLRVEPNSVLKITDYLGLHPNLAPLKALFDEGQLSILQGVGYPNPNRSHFRSMDIWHSAQPARDVVTSGWVGRYFDNACAGCDPHVGVSMGETLPLAMKGDRVTPLSFARPESYRYNGPDKDTYFALNRIDPNAPAPEAPKPQILRPGMRPPDVTEADQLDFLHRTAMDAQLSSDDIIRMTSRFNASGQYPGGSFGNGLRTIAAMIAGGLATRVYYVSLGGFDTHANQRGRHDSLMTQFAQGVSAFWKDMNQHGNAQRVLMVTFSEFGRRVAQNASAGTDHGAAAPMFMVGANIRAGIMGNHPSLVQLDNGDLRYGIDFRSVYATVLQNWLETPSRPILGAQFPLLPVLKA